jgi:hypothetical protein
VIDHEITILERKSLKTAKIEIENKWFIRDSGSDPWSREKTMKFSSRDGLMAT